MKKIIKKVVLLCFLMSFCFPIFLNAEEIGNAYGYQNMFIMKQGKVIIVNSYNNDIRIGYVEEGYTICQINGTFTRNKAFQIRDFNEIAYNSLPADIVWKSIVDNSDWYKFPKNNNECESYIRIFDENNTNMCWVEIFVDESYDYVDVRVIPTDTYGNVINLTDSQINYILQLDDIEAYNSYEDVTNVKNYKHDLNSTISNNIIENVTVPAGYYFANLKENFPTNTVGSCGYIATEILLSYYDVFYNADIIPEQAYGQNMITSVSTNSYDLRYCLNSPGPSESFNQMMIDSVAPYAGITNSATNLALSYNEMVILLNKFMQSFSEYNYNYQVAQLSTMNSILSELDLGRPVILTMYDFAFNETIQVDGNLIDTVHCFYDSGHAAIIYGYEEMANGEIFFKCHTGFKSSQISNITSGYLKLLSNSYEAISLRLTNNVHAHSNSYVYGNTFCPCINNINYSEFCLLDDDVNVSINNEVWIEKREDE